MSLTTMLIPMIDNVEQNYEPRTMQLLALLETSMVFSFLTQNLQQQSFLPTVSNRLPIASIPRVAYYIVLLFIATLQAYEKLLCAERRPMIIHRSSRLSFFQTLLARSHGCCNTTQPKANGCGCLNIVVCDTMLSYTTYLHISNFVRC